MSKAVTHEEVYRKFEGRLHAGAIRFWPIIVAGIRASRKKRWPLFLLFGPILIGTIVSSVGVYARFAAADAVEGAQSIMATIVSAQALKLLEVRAILVRSDAGMSVFALFAVAWYGCGLLCEDRRVGAHQLYFSRPITRLDYYLGKFGVAAFFGSLGAIVPGLIMCSVAVYCAPGWSFLTVQGDIIWRVLAYGIVWILVTCSLTLCASSLFSRRSFAFAAVIGFTMILEAVSHTLEDLVSDKWLAISPMENLGVMMRHILATDESFRIEPATSWMVLSLIVALSWIVTGWRIRRLEVVA